jgi:hypothetical protein
MNESFRVLSIIAMVLSPLIALQVSDWIKMRAERRQRKMNGP